MELIDFREYFVSSQQLQIEEGNLIIHDWRIINSQMIDNDISKHIKHLKKGVYHLQILVTCRLRKYKVTSRVSHQK